jgi:hypothetical protein
MDTKARVDVSHYTYRLEWSAEDQEHVATVLEFPSLSWLDADPVQAFVGLRRMVADTIEDMQATGEEVPQPFSERSYSGKFNLRVPPSLHRKLAIQAAEEHVSLNQLVVRRLDAAC